MIKPNSRWNLMYNGVVPFYNLQAPANEYEMLRNVMCILFPDVNVYTNHPGRANITASHALSEENCLRIDELMEVVSE